MASVSPPREAATAGRLSGRAMLLLVAALTALLTLGLLANDLVRVLYIFDGAYDLEVRVGSESGVPLALRGAESTNAYHWTALLSSQQELTGAKTLQALALALTTLTFAASGVVILLLCRRLWTRRPFATSAAIGLLVIAGLTLVTSWLTPWLQHQADALAFDAMGYPSGGGNLWLEQPHYEAFTFDGTVFVLGIVLALTALVYLGTQRMQRDTEGLI